MSIYTRTEVDSAGRKTHYTFDSTQTGAVAVTVERADGTIEYEMKDGQGLGTTDPKGLYPKDAP